MTERFDLILSADQIRTMIAVVKEGSFNKAASTLGVQQSAVTQLISRLEIKVGRRLFDRTPAGVRLTIDGEAVLIYSQAMVKLSLDLQRHLVTSHAETVLRIGLTEDVGRTALPAVLGLFARHHADFRFEAICGMPDLLFDAFDQDKLDVVIARRVAETGRGEVLWSEDTVWVGAADATLPIADPISLVLPPPGGTRSTVFQALQGASRAWRVSFESASLATLEAAFGPVSVSRPLRSAWPCSTSSISMPKWRGCQGWHRPSSFSSTVVRREPLPLKPSAACCGPRRGSATRVPTSPRDLTILGRSNAAAAAPSV